MRKVCDTQAVGAGGFTIVELVVILLLVGLLAFAVAPRFASVSFDVASQAEQVASDIRYTQALSMARGARYRINLTSTGYQITNSTGVTPEAHPGTSSTSPVRLDGVSLSGYNPPLTNSYVAFDGRGIPYANVAGTAMTSSASIVVSGGGVTRTVVISPETGRVVVQ